MRTQRLVNRWLWGLVFAVVGAVVHIGVVRGQEARTDEFEGSAPNQEGTYTDIVLTGAEKDAFLKAHNDARQAVGLEPLAWSDEIARYSLEWLSENHAEYLKAAVVGKLPPIKHRPRDAGKFQQKYGENIACWSGPSSTAGSSSQAVTAWLTEKGAFDTLNKKKAYVVGDEAGQTDASGQPVRVGHYTQIVWKDTRTIGAAKWQYTSRNGQTAVVIVCNYDPPGNFIGRQPH